MRKRTLQAFLAMFILALSSIVSGCATIVHLGGDEELNVSSEPAGAKVVIDGTERGVTPLATQVERKKDHAVVLTKEDSRRIGRESKATFHGGWREMSSWAGWWEF